MRVRDMRRSSLSRRAERGAALISALLIVSVMSVVALSVIQTIRFSAKLSTNIADREQARLYAIAAEEVAIATLNGAWRAEAQRNVTLDLWTRTPLNFPIPEGTIQGQVVDGANCMNLNAVVSENNEEQFAADPTGLRRFEHFLSQFGVPAADAVTLAAELADWIDDDQRTSFGGAEDDYYTSLAEPYRTGQQYMADISELRSLRSMTPALYETLKPFVCLRPTSDAQPLNLNTLYDWQAPILAAYLGEPFDLNAAVQIIQERPVGGYDSVDTFFEQTIRDEEIRDRTDRSLFSLASDTYAISADIHYRQTVMSVVSTLKVEDSGQITRLSRRYGSVS